MAKLILPLGASSASGQLGKAWVYFSWKGLNLVRTLVVPSNPNTADQQTQRGYFTTAVNTYHGTEYTAVDIASWRRRALQIGRVMTYFNAIVREHINCLVTGDTWHAAWDGRVSAVLGTSFTFKLKSAADQTAFVYWGTTPGYMPTAIAGGWAVGPPAEYTFPLIGLPANTPIYFTCRATAGAQQQPTGIYLQKTA